MARELMIKHGVLRSWDFRKCCDFIGFITYSEEGVNQGSGVVGGRFLKMLIFQMCYKHYGANA